MIHETITIFRPLGPQELELIKESGYKQWPPRLSGQPFFYPVTNEKYATEITVKWNIPDFGVGYVAKFDVNKDFMDKFEIKKVGGANHTEWWIPAAELDELNRNIVGLINIVAEYR
jgi:hypothetical protein